jgi:hypothetical protein
MVSTRHWFGYFRQVFGPVEFVLEQIQSLLDFEVSQLGPQTIWMYATISNAVFSNVNVPEFYCRSAVAESHSTSSSVTPQLVMVNPARRGLRLSWIQHRRSF